MTMSTKIRTYSELITLPTFKERFEYLKLDGVVGKDTFGFDRIFYQRFLKSKEWLDIRDYVFVRDNGCDLAILGHEILGRRLLVHHMNPVSMKDLENASKILLDPEYMITTMHDTHNALHYGDESLLVIAPVERRKNDTCPWRHD